MTRVLSLMVLLIALSACAEYADNTRTAIRSWCENTPEWCNVHAVK